MDLNSPISHVLLAGLTAATASACYTTPPTLGLPCVVDSDCGSGEFSVGGECSANPGASEAGGETMSTVSMTGTTTTGTTTTTTTEPTTTDPTTTSTSTTSTTSTSTSSTTTGLMCPQGTEEVNGECVPILCTEGYCGDVELEWHRTYDSVWAKSDEVKRTPQRVGGLVALPDGGVIVAGEMYGTMVVDGQSKGIADDRALFIAHYDAGGGLVWFKELPCSHDLTVLNDIDYRPQSDQIVIVGTVEGAGPNDVALSLGPGGEIKATGQDVFVAQFDGSGDFVKHRHFSGGGLQIGRAVSYSPSGTILIGGEYENSFDDDDINSGLPTAASKNANTFVISLSPVLSTNWAQGLGSEVGEQTFGDLTTIQGNDVFIVGQYTESLTLPPDTELPAAEGGSALYVVRLSGVDGSHKWSLSADNGNDQLFTGVTSSPSSSVVYASAFVAGELDFGGVGYTSGSSQDMLIMKIANNDVVWAKGFGNDKPQLVTSVGTNADADRVILAGNCRGEIDFGGGLLTSLGFSDVCFAEFDADGVHRWSAIVGGDDPAPNWNLYEQSGPATLVGSDGVYISQRYTNNADLFGTPLAVKNVDDRVSLFARLMAL